MSIMIVAPSECSNKSNVLKLIYQHYGLADILFFSNQGDAKRFLETSRFKISLVLACVCKKSDLDGMNAWKEIIDGLSLVFIFGKKCNSCLSNALSFYPRFIASCDSEIESLPEVIKRLLDKRTNHQKGLHQPDIQKIS